MELKLELKRRVRINEETNKRGNVEHDGAKLGRMRRKAGKKGKQICVFGVKKAEGRGKGV